MADPTPQPSIWQGPAPAPQRRVSLDGSSPAMGHVPGPNVLQSNEAWDATTAPKSPAQAGLSPEPIQPLPMEQAQPSGLRSSPPPSSPDMAAVLSELQRQNGELIRRIGEIESNSRRELERARFNAETMQPVPRPYINLQPPPGIDPEATVNVAAFYATLAQMLPVVESNVTAHAVRATWDVTPQEEQVVLQDFPHLVQRPEPERTMAILRAARMNRSFSAPPNGDPSTPSGSSASRPARLSPQTVPHVEIGPAPMAPEPMGADNDGLFRQARNAYEQAKNMSRRTPQEAAARETALRTSWRRLEELNSTPGVDPRRQGFMQTT